MRKIRFCNTLSEIIGQAFENEPFVLRSVDGKSKIERNIRVTVSDRTGTVQCDIPDALAETLELSKHIGDVYVLSAAISAESRTPILAVTTMKLCTDDYLPTDLYSGLSQEKKDEYIQLIKDVRAKITNESYLALIDACLTDENLKRLGELPATHNDYGVYLGGALAATCSVTYMVMSVMAAYVKKGNGITTTAPGWNVLLTAALLHAFGRIDYCKSSDPFKKTRRGVTMNYFSTLQHSIENVIFKNDISISEDHIASLLNVLAVAVSKKTEVRSVSKDGVVLRSVLRLYGECEAIDYAMANYTPTEDEDFFYAKGLRRFLVTTEDD